MVAPAAVFVGCCGNESVPGDAVRLVRSYPRPMDPLPVARTATKNGPVTLFRRCGHAEVSVDVEDVVEECSE